MPLETETTYGVKKMGIIEDYEKATGKSREELLSLLNQYKSNVDDINAERQKMLNEKQNTNPFDTLANAWNMNNLGFTSTLPGKYATAGGILSGAPVNINPVMQAQQAQSQNLQSNITEDMNKKQRLNDIRQKLMDDRLKASQYELENRSAVEKINMDNAKITSGLASEQQQNEERKRQFDAQQALQRQQMNMDNSYRQQQLALSSQNNDLQRLLMMANIAKANKEANQTEADKLRTKSSVEAEMAYSAGISDIREAQVLANEVDNLSKKINTESTVGTGAYNQAIKNVGKYLPGNVGMYKEREQLDNLIANQLSAAIKAFAGKGAMSDKDLFSIQQTIASGNLSPETISSITNKIRRMSDYMIDKYNKYAQVKNNPENKNMNFLDWSNAYDEANYNSYMNPNTSMSTYEFIGKWDKSNGQKVYKDNMGNLYYESQIPGDRR